MSGAGQEAGALWQLAALEMSALFRDGRLDPTEVLQACLARLDLLDPSLHIMISRHPDAMAQAQASASRWREGRPLSVLDGVPVAVKDNILTNDLPTSWGNPLLATRPGQIDEIAVARLREAGLVILGKTSVPEFTLEGFTANPLVGVTGNPWQPALTPGGSSGGSVAGVAAGCFPLAICTDGGGSIRRPAAYTGLAGFKPSIGRVPRAATLPPLLLDFEVIGPVARDVADLQALFEVIAGPDPRDRSSIALPAASATEMIAPRVLFVPRLGAHPIDPLISVAVRRAVEGLEQAGCVVTEAPLPLALAPIDSVWADIGRMGLARILADEPEVLEAASAPYQAMAQEGRQLSAADALAVCEAAQALRRECDGLFEQFDFVVTPSCAAMPWPAASRYPAQIDGQVVGPRGHAVFTGWVNAAGLPAINLPAPVGDTDLPIGFQLIGRWGGDQTVLDWARRYETVCPWSHRWPTL